LSAGPPAGEPPRVLVLGGTAEARALAGAILAAGVASPVTALAGVTEAPARPPGEVRIGGFGGASGLAAYIAGERIAALIDATHPFAVRISRHACEAATAAGVPRLRLERPAWSDGPADRWIRCADLDAALALFPGLATTVFATVGRRSLPRLGVCADVRFVVRGIEPPEAAPANVLWLRGRPPFDVAEEAALLERHGIEALLVRDSGGLSGWPKLLAARALSLPVVMLRRPEPIPGPSVANVEDAVAWLRDLSAAL
jgi:precorrin-6A/cobalt-precorrin-6A reductase